MEFDVILDCYTDEPSGLGVPPYLGVHSRYVAGCLEKQRRDYYCLFYNLKAVKQTINDRN